MKIRKKSTKLILKNTKINQKTLKSSEKICPKNGSVVFYLEMLYNHHNFFYRIIQKFEVVNIKNVTVLQYFWTVYKILLKKIYNIVQKLYKLILFKIVQKCNLKIDEKSIEITKLN